MIKTGVSNLGIVGWDDIEFKKGKKSIPEILNQMDFTIHLIVEKSKVFKEGLDLDIQRLETLKGMINNTEEARKPLV